MQKQTLLFKLLLCLLFIAMIKTNSYAQTGLNFQGVARSSNNVIIASQQISLRLSILQGSATGSVEYSETRKVTTNAQGLFAVVIGDADATNTMGSFTTINWKNTPKFLKIEMDANAGNNYTTIGTTQFQYVAYAQFASSVDAENIIGVVPVARGGTGATNLTSLKTTLALDKINNTPDIDKPISTKTQSALDVKLNAADTSKYTKQTYTDAALFTKFDVADTLKYTKKSYTDSSLITKLNFTDTASMLSNRIGKDTLNLSARINAKANTTDLNTALLLKANASDVNTSLGLKANASEVATSLSSKVDKISGKELSTNDYSNAEKTKLAAITGTNTGDQDLSSYATNTALALKANTGDVNTALALKANTSDVTTSLSSKVDKISGKELSTNDYSNAEKAKLAAITGTNTGDQDLSSYATNTALALKANTGDVNNSLALKANASEVATSLSSKVDKVAGKELSTNDYSNAEKTKLAAITGTNTGDQDLSSYATNTALVLKANASDVTTSLALKENISNKSSAADLGGTSPSDILYPTQKAVKDYVTANASSGGVADGGITTIKLADGAVTDAKLATGISKSKVGLGNVENTALSTWAGSNNLTTVGTITSGTWSGTAVAIEKGGTGATTAASARTNLGLVIGTDVLAQRTFGTAASNNTNDFEPAIATGAANKFWRGDKTWQVLPSMISLNGLRDSLQTLAISNAGISPSIISTASIHTINIPLASNSLVTAGLLAKSDFDQFYNKSDFSGNYNDLSNKPIIPEAQLQSNWAQADNTKLDFIQNKPSIATIATTGSYTDLLNKPTISDLNGVAANRNLTINGVMYDLSKDRTWNVDLSSSGIDLSKNIITGVLPIINGGTGSSTLNFVDFTNNQTVGGTKKFTNTISVGTATPELTAIVDINSTSKGFLPPRMTTAQRDAIVNPAIGLTIFNTETNCLEWWIGTIWYNACGNAPVSVTSNGTAAMTILDCGVSWKGGFSPGSYDIGTNITALSAWQVITVKVHRLGTYNFIATNNGITYSASGQFNNSADTMAPTKDIQMYANGKAINAGTFTYKLATNPGCEFTALVNTTSSNGSSVISSWGASTTPTGTMMNDKLVNDGEVTQTLTANVGTIGTYKILTANNGITLTGAGTFSATGNNEVILTASGTPINAGTYTFTTNTVPAKSFTRNFLSSTSNGTAVITGFTTGASVGNLYVNNLLGTVSQTIVATVTTAGTYSFTASLNGVTFNGSGTITGTGSQNIILQATGTPTTEGNNFYSINSSIPHSFARQTLSSPSSNGTSVVTSWSCATDTSGALYLGNVSSYVTQTITANVSQVGTYFISTSINGITFAGSGVFDVTGNQSIKLNATGTPTTFGANNFSLNTSNSCTFTRYVKNNLSSNGSAVVNSYTVGSASGLLYANSETVSQSQTIIADIKTVGTYNISTSTNGITYAATGTFTSTGNQTITLIASGTPLIIGSSTATINTNPNCSFTSTALAQPSTNGTAIVSSYTDVFEQKTLFFNKEILVDFYDFGAEVTKLGTYNISKTINGVTVSGNGTFTTLGPNYINLKLTGTPATLGTYTFSINTSVSPSWTFKTVNESTGGTALVTSWSFPSSYIYFYPNVDASGVTTTITANVSRIGTYNISIPNFNDVFLTATGTFTTLGNQTITLRASGIPIDRSSHRFIFAYGGSYAAIINSSFYFEESNGTSIINNIRLGSSSGYLEVNKVANKVTQEIKVNVTQIGSYLISAVSNGVTFNATGDFTSIGEKIITLTASGTPTAEGNTRFTLNVTPSLSFTKQVISAVTIGTQVWMKKNLDVATYRNGDVIPKVTDPAIWAGLTTGAYCYYNNDSATYAAVYGKLYNWYALTDPRGLDIQGWHVPSETEFTKLMIDYGGNETLGGKIKAAGTSLWNAPNTGATNSLSFTALPGGFRDSYGRFLNMGVQAIFGSYSSFFETEAKANLECNKDSEAARFQYGPKTQGLSVRLLKD